MKLHRTLAATLTVATAFWLMPATAQLDEFQGFGSPDEPAIDLSAPEIQPVASDWLLMITANLQSDALASSDAPDTRQQDFELRRARISALLDYRARWSLRAGIDVADGLDLREAAVQYQGARWGVEFGRVVEPFGLLQASTRGASFAERPLALALALCLSVGLAGACGGGGGAGGGGTGGRRARWVEHGRRGLGGAFRRGARSDSRCGDVHGQHQSQCRPRYGYHHQQQFGSSQSEPRCDRRRPRP